MKYLVKHGMVPSGAAEDTELNVVILEIFASTVDNSEFKKKTLILNLFLVSHLVVCINL